MITKQEVQKLFRKWNDALKTLNTGEVLKLYSPDAILLPTLSGRVRHNHEEIGDYFDLFLKMSPTSRIFEENIRIFDEVAINSGIYVFTVIQMGKSVEMPVRFTFVYKKFGEGWLIVEHHSSAMPTEPF
jgi:uncharacterized protein (TIGR02246 family)